MDVEKLARCRYLSLATFRLDGTPVATPVWVARQADELVVQTLPTALHHHKIEGAVGVG